MVAELYEKEQEAGADNAHTEAQHHGSNGVHHRHVATEQHHGQGHDHADESRDTLAGELGIGKDIFLGQNGQQKAAHDERIELWLTDSTHEHTDDHGHGEETEEKRKPPRKEEAVETQQGNLVGCLEGKLHQVDQNEGRYHKAYADERRRAVPGCEQQGQARPDRQGETAKPGHVVIGLCTQKRLALVNHQGRQQEHLRQAKGGTGQESRHKHHATHDPVAHGQGVDCEPRKGCQQQGQRAHHQQAHLVATVVLHKVVAERTERIKSDAVADRHQGDLLHVESKNRCPLRGDHGQHTDGCDEGELGKGQFPKVFVPESDVYGRVLRVHIYI